MYACIHVCLYTCIHVYMYARVHVHMYTFMHVHMYTCMHNFLYIYIHTWTRVDLCTFAVPEFRFYLGCAISLAFVELNKWLFWTNRCGLKRPQPIFKRIRPRSIRETPINQRCDLSGGSQRGIPLT